MSTSCLELVLGMFFGFFLSEQCVCCYLNACCPDSEVLRSFLG